MTSMPNTGWSIEYEVLLDSAGNALRVRIRTERGTVVDFVVHYEITIDDRVYAVVRYDGSHGRGHRDLLDAAGETVEHGKRWLPEHLSLAESLQVGLIDLRANWMSYRSDFHRRLR